MFTLAMLAASLSGNAAPNVEWVPAQWSTESHGCASGELNCPQVSLSWPEVHSASAAAATALRTWVDHSILDNPRGEGLLTAPVDVGRVLELESTGPQTNEFYLRRVVQVVYQDSRCVSLSFSESEYAGGAHPNRSLKLVTFDLATGTPVPLEDLVIDDGIPELLTRAESLFRTQKGIDDEASLSTEDYFFEGEEFPLPKNWAISKEGIVFFYNTYEIGPYSVGHTELVVPLSDLAGILRPGGLLDRSLF